MDHLDIDDIIEQNVFRVAKSIKPFHVSDVPETFSGQTHGKAIYTDKGSRNVFGTNVFDEDEFQTDMLIENIMKYLKLNSLEQLSEDHPKLKHPIKQFLEYDDELIKNKTKVIDINSQSAGDCDFRDLRFNLSPKKSIYMKSLQPHLQNNPIFKKCADILDTQCDNRNGCYFDKVMLVPDKTHIVGSVMLSNTIENLVVKIPQLLLQKIHYDEYIQILYDVLSQVVQNEEKKQTKHLCLICYLVNSCTQQWENSSGCPNININNILNYYLKNPQPDIFKFVPEIDFTANMINVNQSVYVQIDKILNINKIYHLSLDRVDNVWIVSKT